MAQITRIAGTYDTKCDGTTVGLPASKQPALTMFQKFLFMVSGQTRCHIKGT